MNLDHNQDTTTNEPTHPNENNHEHPKKTRRDFITTILAAATGGALTAVLLRDIAPAEEVKIDPETKADTEKLKNILALKAKATDTAESSRQLLLELLAFGIQPKPIKKEHRSALMRLFEEALNNTKSIEELPTDQVIDMIPEEIKAQLHKSDLLVTIEKDNGTIRINFSSSTGNSNLSIKFARAADNSYELTFSLEIPGYKVTWCTVDVPNRHLEMFLAQDTKTGYKYYISIGDNNTSKATEIYETYREDGYSLDITPQEGDGQTLEGYTTKDGTSNKNSPWKHSIKKNVNDDRKADIITRDLLDRAQRLKNFFDGKYNQYNSGGST